MLFFWQGKCGVTIRLPFMGQECAFTANRGLNCYMLLRFCVKKKQSASDV